MQINHTYLSFYQKKLSKLTLKIPLEILNNSITTYIKLQQLHKLTRLSLLRYIITQKIEFLINDRKYYGVLFKLERKYFKISQL